MMNKAIRTLMAMLLVAGIVVLANNKVTWAGARDAMRADPVWRP